MGEASGPLDIGTYERRRITTAIMKR